MPTHIHGPPLCASPVSVTQARRNPEGPCPKKRTRVAGTVPELHCALPIGRRHCENNMLSRCVILGSDLTRSSITMSLCHTVHNVQSLTDHRVRHEMTCKYTRQLICHRASVSWEKNGTALLSRVTARNSAAARRRSYNRLFCFAQPPQSLEPHLKQLSVPRLPGRFGL